MQSESIGSPRFTVSISTHSNPEALYIIGRLTTFVMCQRNYCYRWTKSYPWDPAQKLILFEMKFDDEQELMLCKVDVEKFLNRRQVEFSIS